MRKQLVLVLAVAVFSALGLIFAASGQSHIVSAQVADDDFDQDGWTVGEGDCDDSEFTINPGADDPLGDGIDQNCDGADGINADFGDAPDPTYPTLLASNGPRHAFGGTLFLGAGVDPEADGQPGATALGDDIDGNDDEDGVAFTSTPPLVAGQQANVDVTASNPGLLNAWVDFNSDGDWADAGEQIFTDTALVGGMNSLSFTVPATATPTNLTFARFRVDSVGGLSFDGPALDGEVEDYALEINGVDFGDAPDPVYPTLLASNGARHILSTGPFLGAGVDSEPDGQPTAAADGDDTDLGGDDEDGVVFTSPLNPGQVATIDVLASAAGFLNAWIDFNADGDWTDSGEQIFLDLPLAAGLNGALPYSVPPAAASNASTFARFRFDQAGGLTPTGLASDGEVEDYAVHIEEAAGAGDTIIIIKDTVPDAAQDFGFDTTGGLSPATFDLDDDADGTLSNTQIFNNVTSGIYTVSEAAVSGYTTRISCTDPDGGTITSGNTATIDLDPAETVTCTFTNTVIEEATASVGGVTAFSGGSGSSSASIALLVGGVAAVVVLAAGGWYTRRRWLGSGS